MPTGNIGRDAMDKLQAKESHKDCVNTTPVTCDSIQRRGLPMPGCVWDIVAKHYWHCTSCDMPIGEWAQVTEVINTEISMKKKKEMRQIQEQRMAEVMGTTGYEVSKGLFIPIREETEGVPSSAEIVNHKDALESIAIAVNLRRPVLLTGETGTGKTSLVRYLANKTSNGYRRVAHSGGTTVEDVKGRLIIKDGQVFWADGVLLDAMRHGWWYVADEINASGAEINFVYHSLLDDDGFIVLEENGGEIVRPHKNFRFFATMNRQATYAGTRELNKALLSRFLVVDIDYPTPAVEAKILHVRTGIDERVAKIMARFAKELRSAYKKQSISYALSTRDMLYWAELYGVYGALVPSAQMAVMNKADENDANMVKDLLNLHFGELDKGNITLDECVKSAENAEGTPAPVVEEVII